MATKSATSFGGDISSLRTILVPAVALSGGLLKGWPVGGHPSPQGANQPLSIPWPPGPDFRLPPLDSMTDSVYNAVYGGE